MVSTLKVKSKTIQKISKSKTICLPPGFSLVKSEIMVAPCTEWTPPNPVRLDLSRDLNHAASFPQAGRPKLQRQDRLTGGTGLYMNYSIIYTEISFYPETSTYSNNSYDISDYTRI